MSKKKGVSAAEKEQRCLAFFNEQKTVFSLKELESKLPKEKGIVSMAVKDLVEMMVHEGKVDKDKIGSGNFYWSFASKVLSARQKHVDRHTKEMESNKQQIEVLTIRKRQLLEERPPSEERTAKLRKLDSLRVEKKVLEAKLAKFAATDPEKIQLLKMGATKCKDAANRWTENIMTMLAFLRNMNAEASEAEILKSFELPSDLDLLE